MNTPIIRSIPAASKLRKVSGFDPLAFLRLATSESGQKIVKLELPYKRLWFRMACPDGKMQLKPLHVTDAQAIYEAILYADKADTEPISRVTASVKAAEAANGHYIEAAQDRALNEALDNAGFGIQLCDLVGNPGRTQYGTEIPLEQLEKLPEDMTFPAMKDADDAAFAAESTTNAESYAVEPEQENGQQEQSPVESPAPHEPAVQENTAPESEQTEHPTVESPAQTESETDQPQESSTDTQPVEQQLPESAEADPVKPEEQAQENAPTQSDPEPTQKEPEQSSLQQLLANTQPRVLDFPVQKANAPAEAESSADPIPVNHAQASGYTADMSVEEIAERMTLEEANSVVVQTGYCKGWTLEQVAKDRKASLRFYVNSNNVDNVLKAAAKIVYDAAA